MTSATAASLSWNAITGATGYKVEDSTDGGLTWTTLTANNQTTTYAAAGLTADTAYKFRVAALDATGASAASNSASITTVLPVPTGLATTVVSATEIDLSWNAVTDATGYKIERSLNNSTWTTLNTQALTGTSTTFADTTVLAGTSYYYRLTATNVAGNSAAEAGGAAVLTLPAAPILTAVPASATSINLSWTASPSATNYKLEKSTDGGLTWTQVVQQATLTYTHASLTADTSYKYRVSASNATGSSVTSGVVTISTLLNAPSNMAATVASATEIDLSWNAVTDATGFKIKRSLNGTAWTTLVPSPVLAGTATTYADTGLAGGTTYYYRLSAISAGRHVCRNHVDQCTDAPNHADAGRLDRVGDADQPVVECLAQRHQLQAGTIHGQWRHLDAIGGSIRHDLFQHRPDCRHAVQISRLGHQRDGLFAHQHCRHADDVPRGSKRVCGDGGFGHRD